MNKKGRSYESICSSDVQLMHLQLCGSYTGFVVAAKMALVTDITKSHKIGRSSIIKVEEDIIKVFIIKKKWLINFVIKMVLQKVSHILFNIAINSILYEIYYEKG